MKSQNSLLIAAYRYISNGICVIATDDEKRSCRQWKQYEDRIITIEEAEKLFELPQARGLAIVCGPPSGNLEVIDIDTKYDPTKTLFDDYMQAIKDNDECLHSSLMIIQTRSGGYHLYYRCSTITGNKKLARRETEPHERDNKDDKVRVLIETRGYRGYVIAPPTHGYTVIKGEAIPTITPEQREMLWELARTFNQLVEEPARSNTSRGYNAKEYGLSPFEDYNNRGDVVGLLEQHGWKVISENNEKVVFRRPGKDVGTSGNYNKVKKWFSVFTTSSVFEPEKAYQPYAVYAVLECNKDFKECARRLLAAGYGEKREFFGDKLEKQLYKRKLDGQPKEELIKFLQDKHEKTADQATEIVEKLEKLWGQKVCTFWDISESGRVTINRSNLIDFLHNTGGFSIYYYDNRTTIYKIVQCRDGLIEDVTTEHIKKFLLDYIDSLPETFDNNLTPEDIKEILLKGSDTFFSKGLLEFLPRGHFDFLKDTWDAAFFPFRNGVAVITKDKMELKSYAEINKVIWRSQIIDFDIDIQKNLDYNLVEYFSFIRCICNEEPERWEYALTLIGYILHTYKDPTKSYAVILAEETENEKEGGGTGKGIFFKAISKIINTVIIDGKTFKQDKSFAFQRVGLDTKLLVLEDVKKNVDFEGFYPMITEGMTVEKKNKDELFIPYPDSPKIGMTTNYSVNASGNHGKRRQKVFEFYNFFKPGRTPEDHFGHKLFEGWDRDEWIRFYNLMFGCVQAYLQEGIKEVVNSEKLKRKQIRLSYGEEFLEWFEDALPDLREYRFQMELYKEFLQSADLTEKEYSMKRFKAALISGTETLNLVHSTYKNRYANGAKMISIRQPGDSEPKKPNHVPVNGVVRPGLYPD
jgi:hypothetical protein